MKQIGAFRRFRFIPRLAVVLGGLLGVGVLALTVVGCGLPSVPFLEEPVKLDEEGTVIRFRHASDNDDVDEFRGYELYYKFYTDDGDQLIDDQFQADDDFIRDSPRSPNPNRLRQRGYRRIRSRGATGTGAQPLLAGASGSVQYDLFFPYDSEVDDPLIDENDAYALYLENGSPQPGDSRRLARGPNVEDAEGVAKPFFPFERENDIETGYSAGDADFGAGSTRFVTAIDENNRIEIAIYGLAYGRTTDFEVIYSAPAFLGRIDIFPQ